MTEPRRPKVVLIAFVREAELGLLSEAAKALRREVPGAEIVGLAPRTLRPLLTGLSVDGWIWQPEARGACGLISSLRRRRFDVACVVYASPSRLGHLKLEALALASGARRVVAWKGAKLLRLGRAASGAKVLVKLAVATGLAAFGVMASLAASLLLVPSAARRG